MWPLDLPARAALKLPGDAAKSATTPWAVFDPRWYLGCYPEVALAAGHGDAASVLEYYLDVGQRSGHSPNRLFDEAWHRGVYPEIAERVAAGDYLSGFDAYCRRGALTRSPHWLFNEQAYRRRYPDLTNEAFEESGIVNGYDHYLRYGATEGRIGHVLFDPHVYLSHFDPVDVAAIRHGGVFRHYLARIESAEPELRTSLYFDPVWYLQRYPEIAREVAAGRWKCALHHYLSNETPTAFDPLPAFSESWYLQRDPGLLRPIAAGGFRNGYMHFLQFGAAELRSPSASVDLAWYAARPSVQTDLEQARAPNAFAHWLTIGAPSGLTSVQPETQEVTESRARHLYRQADAALLPIAGRFGYRFECANVPRVSVVMVVRDGFAATLGSIASLRASTSSDVELIIVDCASSDETRHIGRYVSGVKMLRFEIGIDWPRAADAGRLMASAPAVLFLASAVRLAPGSVDRACARIEADGSVAAVGGMLVHPHGVIAQAGGVLWNDGTTLDYGHGLSPLAPEVNFVRRVDFCSLGFLLVRTSALAGLNGFDPNCDNGYAAVDLCVRIAQAGFQVIYDPSVMIVLGAAPPPRGGPTAYFQRKHAAVLVKRYDADGPTEAFARQADTSRRLLFIEDTVPLRRIGSGFVRSNDLVRVIASLGYQVTVFPMNGTSQDLAHVFGDMPESVEVMHSCSLDRLAAFLDARPAFYDTVWLARTHNLAQARPILAQSVENRVLTARIILDTEAVGPQREAMQAALAGKPYDLPAAMEAILSDAAICRQTVAVTEAEAEVLRRCGFPRVAVIGHMIEPRPSVRAFGRRSGILFVGAIHRQDSPNFDGLAWFVDKVLPSIEAALGWETRLTIAGYVAPGVDVSRFEHHPRITLRGPVAEIGPLYNAHRVFIAPTRYAAGAPYKVLEAASFGVPVVATEVLRDELGWLADAELAVAGSDDPGAFAAQVVALYRDETRWRLLREGALRRLQQENGPEGFRRAVAAVLDAGAED